MGSGYSFKKSLSFSLPNTFEREKREAISTESMEDPRSSFEEKPELDLEVSRRLSTAKKAKKKPKKQVLLEGYVEAEQEDLSRTKSLTDEDLDELKGCLDLGFGFSYDEIPELCNTLPALELCYSMSQKYIDDHRSTDASSDSAQSDSSSPIANWRISAPGDHPEDVKARLKYWAQAVACTVKLCS